MTFFVKELSLTLTATLPFLKAVAYYIECNHEILMLVMTQNGAFDVIAFLKSV
jgi:hypothetical protein